MKTNLEVKVTSLYSMIDQLKDNLANTQGLLEQRKRESEMYRKENYVRSPQRYSYTNYREPLNMNFTPQYSSVHQYQSSQTQYQSPNYRPQRYSSTQEHRHAATTS